MSPITGVCPVLEVPFHEDESVDYRSFERVITHVATSGARGMMFSGFASEYYKLSDQERLDLLQLMIDGTSDTPGIVTVASVPDHPTHLAVAHANEAIEIGAQAINLLPPHFLNPSKHAVMDHVAAVLDAVAPNPVMLQYAPAQTNASIAAATLNALASEHDNLVAAKVESALAGRYISELRASPNPLPALVGNAGLHLPDALRHGAVGVQPGCSLVEVYVAIWDAWERGDDTDAFILHRRLLPYLTQWTQSLELLVAAEKYVSWCRGLIDTWLCRRPGHVLDDEDIATVDAAMDEFADFLPRLKTPGRDG